MSSPPRPQAIGVSHREDSPKRALRTVLNVLQSALRIFAPSSLLWCAAQQTDLYILNLLGFLAFLLPFLLKSS